MRWIASAATCFLIPPVISAELTPADLPHIDRFDQHTTAYLYRAGGETLNQQLTDTLASAAGASPGVQTWFAELDRMGTLDRKGVRLYRFIRQAMSASHVYASRVADPLDPDDEPHTAPEIGRHHIALFTPTANERDSLHAAFRDLKNTSDASEMRDSGGRLMLAYDDWQMHLQHANETITWATTRAALEGLELPPLDALAESEHFRTTVAPLLIGQEKLPIALYYYDLRPFWQPLDAETHKLWNDLSWRGIDALAGATFVQDGRFFNRHYWKLGKKRTGLLRKIEKHPLRHDWFRAVPEDASLVASGVWRAGSFMVSLRLLNEWLSGSKNVIAANLDLPRRLAPMLMNVQSVGSRYLLYRRPTRYTSSFFAPGLLPMNDMVLLVELEDSDYFVESMTVLPRIPGFQWTPARYHQFAGTRVGCLPFGVFSIYLAAVGDIGIVTTSGQLMKDAIERVRAIDKQNEASDSGVLAELKHVPKDACFFAYAPPGGLIHDLYESYMSHLVELPNLAHFFSNLPFAVPNEQQTHQQATGSVFDIFAIPRARDLTLDVRRPTTLVARDLGEGILFEGHSDLIATPLLVTHLHAMTRFHSKPVWQSLTDLFNWLQAPAQPLQTQQPEAAP